MTAASAWRRHRETGRAAQRRAAHPRTPAPVRRRQCQTAWRRLKKTLHETRARITAGDRVALAEARRLARAGDHPTALMTA
jgi:hypothetical protein